MAQGLIGGRHTLSSILAHPTDFGRLFPHGTIIHDHGAERGLAQDVAKVLSANLGGLLNNVLARVTGQREAFDLKASFAVLLDGKPIAVMTTRHCDVSKVWIFPSFVVNKDKRTGWASVWLRNHWLLVVARKNMIADITFEVREQYKDTLKFAARTNAVAIGGTFDYSKRIG